MVIRVQIGWQRATGAITSMGKVIVSNRTSIDRKLVGILG